MRVFRLTRTMSPLSSSSIMDIFERIETRIGAVRYESVQSISPSSGDLFLIDTLDMPISDGQSYFGKADIFHEEKFDVVIDRTNEPPHIFRFSYYSKMGKYRLLHYLLCEQKGSTPQPPKDLPTPVDGIVDSFLSAYHLVQSILLPQEDPEPLEELDSAFWKQLVLKHMQS
ncbi:hypothetical protein NEDG_00775 [Nematocida displodere]|uniref:Uncharacterized protein n=1 Tax=Nematocida displodere TaxID=1805483 RepID=A0A177EES6_9MICR|nr:hypothetical protein NEDG_00775 [Nematocida displodere]